MEENQLVSDPQAQANSNAYANSDDRKLVNKISFESSNLPIVLAAFFVVFAGIVTGWFLSGRKKLQETTGISGVPTSVQTEKEAGIKDESAFRDSAEGVLRQGGINGEGTHHLERDGGPSQYVYLTSSVIDLSAFEGKKVKVWGETISAAKAGWFMDVGRVKIIE